MWLRMSEVEDALARLQTQRAAGAAPIKARSSTPPAVEPAGAEVGFTAADFWGGGLHKLPRMFQPRV
jgi:hypothetical protein